MCCDVLSGKYFHVFSCLDLTLPPNQYQVTIQSTEASRRCQLAGEYLVSPENEAVVLLAIDTGHVIYRWPYRLLRKFGQVEVKYFPSNRKGCKHKFKLHQYSYDKPDIQLIHSE